LITYIGKQASARTEVQVELDHHCSLCQKVSAAVVKGRGRATEQRTLLEPGGSISADARFNAEVNAQRDAATLIRLAVCPHCGRRDPIEVRRFLTGTILPPVAIAILIALALDFFAEGPAPSLAGMIAVVFAVAALYIVWRATTMFRGSRARVDFVSGSALDSSSTR
jgi:hypothetical protein